MTVEPLREHLEALPVLHRWFMTEWPGYYGAAGPGDAMRDLLSFANGDGLPIGFVACDGDSVCGFAALKAESIASHSHLSPWVAAGLVEPVRRGRGIGARLLAALENEARTRGFHEIHCATNTSASLLQRNGWELLERVVHDGEFLGVYRKALQFTSAASAGNAGTLAGVLGSGEHVMKDTLKPGIRYQHTFVVPSSKTVPALYPEAEEFLAMPEVFATGFLVGFLEWACLKAINPYLDWPREQSVGTHIDVSHEAATPPGLAVTATVELIAVEGRKLVFAVEAHDGVELISKGRHERYVIDRDRFEARVGSKRGKV